jgi:hypothetical protein
MSRSLNMDGIQVPLWGISWLMYANYGCIELESVQIDAILKNGHLDCHDIGICEMWARAEDTDMLFWQIQQEGVQPNSITFMAVLNVCATVVASKEGRYAHEQIIQSRWHSDVFLGRSLMDMYATCVGA